MLRSRYNFPMGLFMRLNSSVRRTWLVFRQFFLASATLLLIDTDFLDLLDLLDNWSLLGVCGSACSMMSSILNDRKPFFNSLLSFNVLLPMTYFFGESASSISIVGFRIYLL